MADSYHHGNLRQALIDAGIKIINENGEENLSLRKVAAACGVSHAAPYAHFKDKDELIEAIKDNVTEKFMEKLVEAVYTSCWDYLYVFNLFVTHSHDGAFAEVFFNLRHGCL